MSVPSTTNRVQYTGDGANNTYDYTYRIFVESDLLVTVTDLSDVETTLALSTDYTVTGVGDASGGTIVLVDSGQAWLTSGDLTSGFTITIRRVLPLTQGTDIRNQGDFFPEVHEDEFDRSRMIDQQQQDELDRSWKFPESVDPVTFDATIPAAIVGEVNRTISTNATGDGLALGPSTTEIEAAEANVLLAEAWATKTDDLVDATDNSSKAYAIGGTGGGQPAAGDAKSWATNTASTVDGSGYSAKEWALGLQTRGTAGGGSAKDWANYIGGTVDDTEFSAKKYADDSSTSAASAAASLAAIQAAIPYRDVVFLTNADSPYTVTAAQAGIVFSVDASGGAVTINLPIVANVTSEPKMFGFKKTDSSSNAVTLVPNGSETIDGGASFIIDIQNAGAHIIPDTDPAPDDYTVLNFGAGGGVGGGVDVEWFTQNDAPLEIVDSNSEVFSFEDAESQFLYGEIRIPDGFVPGKPIALKGHFFTGVTTGTALFTATATLIRVGTDANTSTTNQHTSTNTAITVNGTANVATAVEMDLTDSVGEINSVQVNPGDRIKIRMTRNTGTDTAADAVEIYKKGYEVTLS